MLDQIYRSSFYWIFSCSPIYNNPNGFKGYIKEYDMKLAMQDPLIGRQSHFWCRSQQKFLLGSREGRESPRILDPVGFPAIIKESGPFRKWCFQREFSFQKKMHEFEPDD